MNNVKTNYLIIFPILFGCLACDQKSCEARLFTPSDKAVVTAKPNEDGSITINFGGCEDGRVNCIPVREGWNYTVRMYEPREEAINGIYKFPEIKEVK